MALPGNGNFAAETENQIDLACVSPDLLTHAFLCPDQSEKNMSYSSGAFFVVIA